jgi:hypothetical protein
MRYRSREDAVVPDLANVAGETELAPSADVLAR